MERIMHRAFFREREVFERLKGLGVGAVREPPLPGYAAARATGESDRSTQGKWCERGDSNPQGLLHRILSPAPLD